MLMLLELQVELLLELLLLLLLYVFIHVLIRGREAPLYNYVIDTYSRSTSGSSSSKYLCLTAMQGSCMAGLAPCKALHGNKAPCKAAYSMNT